MSFKMTVKVPNLEVFEAYWYGSGEVDYVVADPQGGYKVVVDYGDDEYRANYQAARFSSGLYWAVVHDHGPTVKEALDYSGLDWEAHKLLKELRDEGSMP